MSRWRGRERLLHSFIYLSSWFCATLFIIKPFVFLRLGALEISYYNDDDDAYDDDDEEDGYDDDDDNVLRCACCSPKLYRQVIVAWSPCVCMCE